MVGALSAGGSESVKAIDGVPVATCDSRARTGAVVAALRLPASMLSGCATGGDGA
ncbi:hypothetical protein NB693_22850 [Pantoea ananatis]|uniref:hypothetical protein n=1 Tax=Pantoea ananas TaxID=553 RepID=UPI00221E6A8A|nr:hypothetical protein [Pantoea ananatis]